jgi:exonuclease VII small subunit
MVPVAWRVQSYSRPKWAYAETEGIACDRACLNNEEVVSKIEPLVRLSDATSVIEKLRARVVELEAAQFQARVDPWMGACFGPEISSDKLERGDRFLEEALELLQSGNYPRERVSALTNYVFDRPQGEINQEVGGVMVTLAAYCLAFGLDMHAAGETELARIWGKVEQIRAKQAAKPKMSPLPIALSEHRK